MSEDKSLLPIQNACREMIIEPRTYQDRASFWANHCFGEGPATDLLERQDRFLEEVFEFLQANGYDPERIVQIRDYTYQRGIGDPDQELGGIMLTLAVLCAATGQDMNAAAEAEIRRVWTKIDKIRAKQAAKPLFQAEAITLERNTGNDCEEGESVVSGISAVDQKRAMEFAKQAMRENGFDEDAVEDFAEGEMNALPTDVVLKAIDAALKVPRIPAGPDLRKYLAGAIDSELMRQSETLPGIETVGEPEGTRIVLNGTFDLEQLAASVENFVQNEMQALNYGYQEMHRQLAEMRRKQS